MRKIFVWGAAIIITLSAAIYQRMTGPTYPQRFQIQMADKTFNFSLPRSASVGEGAEIHLPLHEKLHHAHLLYRNFPGDFCYDTIRMQKDSNHWKASLPVQPPAAKIEYFVELYNEQNQLLFDNHHKTAILRFKGDVPAGVLIPHVIAMFLAMLFSTTSAIMAAFKTGNFRKMAFISVGLLTIGGLILGPIVQYYAFGDAWTGWPVGKDLTDNKTLIAAFFWYMAIFFNLKASRRWPVIVAAVLLLAVYSIPHSAYGSQYNYESGKVETGNKNN